MKLPPLPILEVLAGLKQGLGTGSAVLAAPPGSGKTTVVPLALLAENWLAGRKIVILEPRRLAARAAAARMAELLGEEVGRTVGYQIRFSRKIGPETRIEVLTEGILTRRLQQDPALAEVGLVIFDEFHERSLHADLALALCLEVAELRDDLRLLVMSATLETEPIARLLGGVPVIVGGGRSHEVEIDYQPGGRGRSSGPAVAAVAAGIARAAERQDGDILVFLPGRREIEQTRSLLAERADLSALRVLPLYGDLGRREQDLAVAAPGEGVRRIILATDIAETSLTIAGVRAVVDSGWSRRPRFDGASGLTRLVTVRVSRASARQRAGRAGRLGPGYCLRLWSREEHQALLPFQPPEIVTADLAEVLLELALWGVRDPAELRWLDPPRDSAVERARALLLLLGALDDKGRITARGRRLAPLPGHPRLAHMLLSAAERGLGSLAADLAAILSERDLLGREEHLSAEVRLRLEALARYRRRGAAGSGPGVDPSLCRLLDRAAGQWRRSIGVGRAESDLDEAGGLLVYGYPDRIAGRRERGDGYLLSSGKGAVLPPGDPLINCGFLVVPHLAGGRGDGRIYLAEPVALEELEHHHASLLQRQRSIFWDPRAQRVETVEREMIGALVIRQRPLAGCDQEAVATALLQGIAEMGPDCLPWSAEARQLQLRVALLRANGYPDLPDLDAEALFAGLDWLAPYVAGMRSREDLQRLDMVAILEALLGYDGARLVRREAPAAIRVPSGSRLRLNYVANGPPQLAVRIQEMFGCSTTPTVCRGAVAVVVHLLSPAARPVQVTTDLEGFWRRSYGEVVKELKGRYPKHFWPEDPLTAQATRKVKPKKRKG